MASAWGSAWGSSWGNAWGQQSTELVGRRRGKIRRKYWLDQVKKEVEIPEIAPIPVRSLLALDKPQLEIKLIDIGLTKKLIKQLTAELEILRNEEDEEEAIHLLLLTL